MAVRSTMSSLIARVRVLINDPSGTNQIFDDPTIQDVMDESRVDVYNHLLTPKPTFTGSTVQYLDYFSELGGWETDVVTKQFLTTTVTPSLIEPIAGHFQYAQTTLPPVFATGKMYDVYRAAADLLERWAARLVLNYDFMSDGQSFKRSQAATALQALAKTYRLKQRPSTISTHRSDMNGAGQDAGLSLGPVEIDYLGSGDGR